jgi:murein DD-endopeptidase MepM/ murein hydrolase activator NlpD
LAPPSSQPDGQDPRLAGARFYTAGLPRHKPGFYGEGGPEYSSPREVARPDPDPADEAYDAPRRAKPQERQVASIDPADEAYDPSRRTKPSAPSSDVKASSRFVWPVRGQIISGFGKRASGVHNDGINIAAEPGSSVKAADNGVVVYAGNELAGYGNLLLIRHSNGFVTAYAHNKKLLVSKGDNVRQGQTIALVGSTGDVDRPQLHFEIRKGDRAVDPSRYLESANASL